METKFKFIKKLKNQKGFSLVELMVVVAIIGILAAIAIPNYQKFQRKSQQVEAKTLMSGLYANQVTFQNEWNFLSASFSQLGFEVIGDQPKYNVGWADASAADASMPVAADKAVGYRGPPLIGTSSIQIVNTTGPASQKKPHGCKNEVYCNNAALLSAFSTAGPITFQPVATIPSSCTNASSCSCASGGLTGCGGTGCGSCVTYNGKIDKNSRQFVIGAAGDIGGDDSDQWYMDYKKIILNTKSGL